MCLRQKLTDNPLFYLSKVDGYGWWAEILPMVAILDLGHVKTPPESTAQGNYLDYWYVDFRLPLGKWHSLKTTKKPFRRKAR